MSIRYYAKISGTGMYVPDKILTNFDLEKMVDTTDEWIKTRTGMSERHLAADDQAASDLAYEATKEAEEDELPLTFGIESILFLYYLSYQGVLTD